MAIFSKKTEEQDKPAFAESTGDSDAVTDNAPLISWSRGKQSLIIPRLSEKASILSRINKYVFRVEGKVNKIELRRAIEKAYGVKVARINIITVKGKSRRYGRTVGTTRAFKKAIVTLTQDSKKIDAVEPA